MCIISYPHTEENNGNPSFMTKRRSSTFQALIKDTDTDKCNDSNFAKKSVTFHQIKIREYPYVLGDNPSVSYGPPVSIGWDYEPETVIPVDTYETTRIDERRRRRRQKTDGCLVLSSNERIKILKNGGHYAKEIFDMMRDIQKIKETRQKTIINFQRKQLVRQKLGLTEEGNDDRPGYLLKV